MRGNEIPPDGSMGDIFTAESAESRRGQTLPPCELCALCGAMFIFLCYSHILRPPCGPTHVSFGACVRIVMRDFAEPWDSQAQTPCRFRKYSRMFSAESGPRSGHFPAGECCPGGTFDA